MFRSFTPIPAFFNLLQSSATYSANSIDDKLQPCRNPRRWYCGFVTEPPDSEEEGKWTEILEKKIKCFKNEGGEEYQIAGNFIHLCKLTIGAVTLREDV